MSNAAQINRAPGSLLDPASQPAGPFRLEALLFWSIPAAFVVWTLALPIFPSQDGPMHRYYVHVMAQLLQHQSVHGLYQIRHPFPPYATHYFLLLGLSSLFSFDLAERLFVCITILLFGLGLRMTAREVGPAGRWSSLFVGPLLLSWSLLMGFFNYALGVSLVLIATGLWQRSRNGHVWSLLPYAFTVAVLTFTHPVPLLLLIFLLAIDFALGYVFRPRVQTPRDWLTRERVRLLMFVLTMLAMSFPAHSIDRNPVNTANTISETHFKPEFVRTALLLTGMSPYNSRTLSFWLNSYRLCLYIMLLGACWIGARACRRALRDRQASLGTTMAVAVPMLLMALPILPNQVNGSFSFSTRLIMVLWPAALIAASVARAPAPRQQRWIATGAVVSTLVTLVGAQLFLRPVAEELKAIEGTPLPQHEQGVLLLGQDLPDYARYHSQLAFNPYEWGSLLPVVRNSDVVLDTPWLEQKIAPIAPAPASHLLLDDVTGLSRSKTSPPKVEGHSLPARAEADLVRRAQFIVMAAPPFEIRQRLIRQLSADEAAKFSCEPVREWYQVCQSR